MTNYEKIKSMSLEEMAESGCRLFHDCNDCPAYKICDDIEICDDYGGDYCEYYCEDFYGFIKWLESEAEENDEC